MIPVQLKPKYLLAIGAVSTFGMLGMILSGSCPTEQQRQQRGCWPEQRQAVQKVRVKTLPKRVVRVDQSTVWRWDDRWDVDVSARHYMTSRGNDAYVAVHFQPTVKMMSKHANLKRFADHLGHYPEIPMIEHIDGQKSIDWAFIPTRSDQRMYQRNHPLFPSRVSVAKDDQRVYAVYYNPKFSGGAVYALSRKNGGILWRLAFKGHAQGVMSGHRMKLIKQDNHLMLYTKEGKQGYVQRIHAERGELLNRRRVSALATNSRWQPVVESTSVPKSPMAFRYKDRWTWQMAYKNRSNVRVDGQTLFVANYGKMSTEAVVYAMDAHSGDVKWAKSPSALKSKILLKTKGVRVEPHGDYVYVYIDREHSRVIEVLSRKTGRTVSVMSVR